MKPLPIIKNLYKFKYAAFGLCFCQKRVKVNMLSLQRVEKAFNNRIVIGG
jgi:hypothetical protein